VWTLIRVMIAAALALGGLLSPLTATGSTADRLKAAAGGGGLLLIAALIASPFAIRVLARIVAWPLERRGEVVTQLAREHAAQHASRTAVSASSLTIGLSLVLLVTVYANGLRASTRNAIRQTFVGDVAIENQDGSSPIPAASVRAVADTQGVQALSSLKTASATLTGAGTVSANGIEPTTWGQVYKFEWIDGSDSSFENLGIGDALVEQDTARADHLVFGDHVTFTTGGGREVTALVTGIYRDAGLLHGITLASAWFDALFDQPRLQDVFVKLGADTTRSAAIAQLDQVLSAFPGVVARSQAQLAAEVTGGVNAALALFYALLVLSVLMSLLGIAGTLNLQVHERTRELGMLRALGMTPEQARGMVRDEAMITASIGSLTGLALGLLIAWAAGRALAAEGFVFSVPWPQIAGVLVAGLLAGVLAALPPGRRAARLDVLAAIAHQ
jgi:putative ABC transport system permease protein